MVNTPQVCLGFILEHAPGIKFQICVYSQQQNYKVYQFE